MNIKKLLGREEQYLDLTVEYERNNQVERMEILDNLYKQGVRVVTL